MSDIDVIISGKYILTPQQILSNAAIAISDGIIVDIGDVNRICSTYNPKEFVERGKHIILPGFIDYHTHTQQFLIRSIIDDALLQQPPVWTTVLIPFEQEMGVELAHLSTQASIINMLKHGITCFIEAGAPYPEVLAEEVVSQQIKGIVSYATYDKINDRQIADFEKIVAYTKKLCKNNKHFKNIQFWPSIRQLTMASEELINHILEIAIEYKTGLTLHLAEHQGEVDFTLQKYRKRPLQYLIAKNIDLINHVVAAHGVFLSLEEIELARRQNLTIAWCPTVDSWIMGIHWASYQGLNSINLGFGTDGGAWNKLDLLHEAKIAKSLGKAATNILLYCKSSMQSHSLLQILTGNKAPTPLPNLGRISPGYAADLVVLEIKDITILPIYNLVNSIINYAEGNNITDVLINGKFVIQEKKILTINEEHVIDKIMANESTLQYIYRELMHKLLS